MSSNENPNVPNSENVTAEELTLYQRCRIKYVIGIYIINTVGRGSTQWLR